MTDDLERVRQLRQRRRATQPAGNFGLAGPKAARANRVLAKVEAADDLREITAGRKAPTPERITMALDLRELYGPEVDEALGGEEPMVDEWESAERTPTYEQVQALARLTDFPVRFFYQPPPPPLSVRMCGGLDPIGPL
jgi:transcriptional regulator with XRE-family HTH domain